MAEACRVARHDYSEFVQRVLAIVLAGGSRSTWQNSVTSLPGFVSTVQGAVATWQELQKFAAARRVNLSDLTAHLCP